MIFVQSKKVLLILFSLIMLWIGISFLIPQSHKLIKRAPAFNELQMHKGTLVSYNLRCSGKNSYISAKLSSSTKPIKLPCSKNLTKMMRTLIGKNMEIYTYAYFLEEPFTWHVSADGSIVYGYEKRKLRGNSFIAIFLELIGTLFVLFLVIVPIYILTHLNNFDFINQQKK